MSIELYAYRPNLGVAVAQFKGHWILAEIGQSEAEVKLISMDDSILLAERLGLVDHYQTFQDFSRFMKFLEDAYHKACPPEEKPAISLEYKLGILLLADVLGLIEVVKDRAEKEGKVRNGVQVLEAIAAHPKYEANSEVLGRLNPILQRLRKALGWDITNQRQALGDLEKFQQMYPTLGGNEGLKRQLERYRPFAA